MNQTQLLQRLTEKCGELKQEIAKAVVGQQDIIDKVLITLFCNGHCLLTGVPGLAKTLLVKTIAQALGAEFNRVQFTPDLMPADITGSEILSAQRQMEFVKGPVFTNILLADEINRTSPKTQSALLEAMQEHSITAGGRTFKLDEPFFVMATQNPIEQEGTYPLPEAQLDRFMFMLVMDYPQFEQEIQILKTTTTDYKYEIQKVMDKQDITDMQQLIRQIPVSDNVYSYTVSLVGKTRRNNNSSIADKYLMWGAGTRACQYLIAGAKCYGALRGKFSPDTEDVKAVCKDVLRHRIVLNYSAQSEGLTADDIIEMIMNG
ncbi:MAG: MoxR family ATPase [Bacteroidales bacterium]|nr:MoxR family ATPase [Bacteroidales bacterium]